MKYKAKYENERDILIFDENIEEDSQLTKRAKEVDCSADTLQFKKPKEVRQMVSTLKRTLRKNDLASLSAPAIGYDMRAFALDFKDKEVKVFINPFIANVEGMELSREVCSSLPDREYIVPRNSKVDIYYQTATGQQKSVRFSGIGAFVVQHEMQHLDGILLEDIGLEIDEDWDSATDEEREEVIKWYLDSLDIQSEELEKDINANESDSFIRERVRFTDALAEGTIELVPIDKDNLLEENEDVNDKVEEDEEQ